MNSDLLGKYCTSVFQLFSNGYFESVALLKPFLCFRSLFSYNQPWYRLTFLSVGVKWHGTKHEGHAIYKIHKDTNLPEHQKEICTEQVQTREAAKCPGRYGKAFPEA